MFQDKYLYRTEIKNKYFGYHSKNNISNNEKAKKYIDELGKFFRSYKYEEDTNFIMSGRKKYLYEEIFDILDGKKIVYEPLYYVLGAFEEFISNNNYIGPDEANFAEVSEKNKEYKEKGYICLEERKYIGELLNKINEYISKTNI